MKNKIILGILLIVVGIAGIASRYIDMESFLPLIIAMLFFALYIYNGYNKSYRNIGFLIIGLFVLMGQMFVWFEDFIFFDRHEDIISTLMVAAIFLIIFLIHTYWFRYSPTGKRYWPLIVSGIMCLASIIIYIDEYLDDVMVENLFELVWPLGLIIVGIVVLLRGLIGKQKQEQEDK